MARITIGGDISSADLTAGSTILEGEISRTDKFDGFVTGIVVDTIAVLTGDPGGLPVVGTPVGTGGATISATLTDRSGNGAASVEDINFQTAQTAAVFTGINTGVTPNIITYTGVTSGDIITVTYNDFQTLNLTKLARDATQAPGSVLDGVLDSGDVTVKVSGTPVAPQSIGLNAAGNGIAKVIISADVNGVGGNNILVTYKFSEYDQANPSVNSPLSAVTKISQAGVSRIVLQSFTGAGLITLAPPLLVAQGDSVVIRFDYDVKERIKDLVTVLTPTAIAQGLDGKGTGDETTATTNRFSGTFALFSLLDFLDIKSAALITGITTIADLEAALDTADADTSVGNRVLRAAAHLGLATTQKDGLFLERILPVSDGETLTVSYNDTADASGNPATVTKTAIIDLTGPVLALELPADRGINGVRRPTLRATVTYTGAGRIAGAVNIVPGGFSISQVTDPISNGFRLSASPAADLADGKYNWHVTVTDKVGNSPKSTDTRSAIQKTQGDANPAVRGTAGNPFEFQVDTTAPVLASIPAKTGGKIDDRLAVDLTGSSTSANSQVSTTLIDGNASFKTSKVRRDDKVTNVDGGWTATVAANPTSETQLTLTGITATTAGGGCTTGCAADLDWDSGDGYTIENPTLATVIESSGFSITATSNISVIFSVGNGLGPIDPVTVTTGDFNVVGIGAPVSVQVGKLSEATKEQGVLLTLASSLATDARPKIELVGTLADLATPVANVSATVTGVNAPTALDKLAPAFTVAIVGDASSRPVSRREVVITAVTSEAATTPTGTARYLVKATDDTLEEASTRTVETQEVLDGKFTLTGTNTWEATLKIFNFVGSPRGLVNVRLAVTDLAGNRATLGNRDPDGSDGKLVPVSLLLEFDNALNDGVSPTFDLRPGPFIGISFDNEGTEHKFITAADLASLLSEVEPDSHTGVDLTKATLTMPDGSTGDVLAGFSRTDPNSFALDGTQLVTGDYTLAVQAQDHVANVSTTPGGITPTEFVFQFRLTSGDFLSGIQGQVLLQGRDSSLGAYVIVDGGLHFADATGSYDIPILLGTYDVTLTAPGYLSVTITGLQVGSAPVVLPTFTLPYGDADGDGVIDVKDLVIPANNLGKTSTTIAAP